MNAMPGGSEREIAQWRMEIKRLQSWLARRRRCSSLKGMGILGC